MEITLAHGQTTTGVGSGSSFYSPAAAITTDYSAEITTDADATISGGSSFCFSSAVATMMAVAASS